MIHALAVISSDYVHIRDFTYLLFLMYLVFALLPTFANVLS